MSQSQIVIPDADEQLKRMLVEERELASAIDAAKEKMKPIKDRHAQLQKSMLSWAKQHHTTIGVEVHVTQGKSIAIAESFSTERITEESLQRILGEYFVKQADLSQKEAEASAKELVTFIYDNREKTTSTRLVIKDAVALALKRRAAEAKPKAAKKQKQ